MERKVDFLTCKLRTLRLEKDLKLNINLFKVFCMPLYRLGMLQTMATTETDRQHYLKSIRKKFRSFCFLPRNTPNEYVRVLLGSVEDDVLRVVARVNRNRQLDEGGGVPGSTDSGECFTRCLHVPTWTARLLDLMMRHYCRVHNHILSSSHLVEHGWKMEFA